MATIQEPIKIGSYWTNLIESDTGENVNFEETAEWWDGTPMDDGKCDGDLFRKLPVSVGGGYVRKVPNEKNAISSDKVSELMYFSGIRAVLPDGRDSLSNIVDRYTGESLQLVKIASLPLGSTVDNIIYYQTSNKDFGTELWARAQVEYESIVNIRWFGAVGDGVNDDAPAFQACIDNIQNKTLVIPAGRYRMESGISIPMSKQIVIRGEGQKRRGASTSTNGITVLEYAATTGSHAIELQGAEGVGRTHLSLRGFNLTNVSGRTDVDGLIANNVTGTEFKEIDISGFRDNLVINSFFFYNVIERCGFRNATRHGIYSALGVKFNGTEIRNSWLSTNTGWGFFSEGGLGEIITFRGNYIEVNGLGGLCLKRALVANVENNYFEFNSGINVQLYNRPTPSGSGTNNIVANVSGNKFRSGDDVHIVESIGYEGDYYTTLNLFGNVIENYDISLGNVTTYLISATAGSTNLILNIDSNVSSAGGDGRVMFSNRKDLAFFNKVNIGNDHFVATEPTMRDGVNNNPVFTTGAGLNVVRTQYADLDGGATSLDIRFPGKVVSDINTRIGISAQTTGSHLTEFFSGSGVRARVDHNNGRVEALNGFTTVGPSKRGIYIGSGNPEGQITAPEHSLFLSTTGVYRKVSGTGNTGWSIMSVITASTDTATQAVGTEPTKAEFDALLAELRDLKTKMRAAGLLAT